MANTNTTTNIIDSLLAQGLLALRENAIMPRFVNRGYENVPGDQYSTIDIPIPSAITAGAVSPSNTPPDDTGISPTKVTITLDQWYEAPFFLNDQEMLEVTKGTIPMQASEAIKALANNIDDAIFALYPTVYGWGGVAGTTPFATDLGAYLDARAALGSQLAPMDPRYCVVDVDAEANALGLRAFQDASFRGDTAGIRRGDIGEKLGAFWAMDQNVPSHTAGTASGATVDASGYAVGATSITIASAGTGTILVGDIITFAGDTQTYAITTGDTDVSDGGTIVITPGLKVAIATSGSPAITVKATHKLNLVFQRDWAALAMRPFAGADPMGVGTYSSAVDPVSGLALRLEVSRQHKRTRFAYDVLYGVQIVRPEFCARLAG
jgi:hypothetical protein